MKHFSAALAVILCLLLCLQVFADELPTADGSRITSVNVSVTMTESGHADVTQTMTLALDGSVQELRLAVPEQAEKAKVTDRKSKLTTVDGTRCLLLKSEDGFSGTQTFTLHFTMEDLVKDNEDGQLLTLPLLAAQDYPTDAMTLTVSLPKEYTSHPSFTSGYLGGLIVDSLLLSTGSTSFAATVTEQLKDHETLSVSLQLEAGYFVGHFGESPFSLITTIAVFVLLALGILYWARLLRNGRLPVHARSLPPDGVNPGDLPFLLSGGDADFNMLVSHWATLGYVSFYIHKSGHVLLRRRMGMGNERRPMERKLFDLLFRDGDVCDGASLHYKRTGEAAMAAIPRYWSKRLYNRRSGAPSIARVLCCLACAVATMQSMDTVAPEKLHVLFLLLAFVAGYALCWLMQLACGAWFLNDWVKVGAGGAAALLLLILGLLGDAALTMLPALAVSGFLSWQTVHGGIRSPYGNEVIGQTLGFRRFMRHASDQHLRQMLYRDPQYFYRILPYAEAMGLGRQFVSLCGEAELEPCQWYEAAENIPHTASAFYAHYCETLAMLNLSIRK